MAETLNIYELSEQTVDTRDLNWEAAFLHALPESRFHILHEDPKQGPDGWPYLLVQMHPDGSESAMQVLEWLAEKGVGLAINPHKDSPDFVLSYGMIWNFKERKSFLSAGDSVHLGQIKFDRDQKVLSGPPSSDYLPDYSRAVLKAFLSDNGVSEAKVLVMTTDQKHYDLCFSLESFGQPAATEHKGILEAISWFLPAHYSIVLISETGLPPFYPL